MKNNCSVLLYTFWIIFCAGTIIFVAVFHRFPRCYFRLYDERLYVHSNERCWRTTYYNAVHCIRQHQPCFWYAIIH